ncbi:MAG: type II secretion system F family protein [Crocinitomicaceae bacterium]
MGIKLEQHIAPTASSKGKEKEGIFSKELSFGSTFNDKKKERFYLDLRVLLVAGVDLKSALEIIIEEQEKEKDKTIFKEIHEGVVKGKSLAACLKATGKFSEYEYYSIEIGEEANRLKEVLDQLMDFFAERTALKRQIISVLTYPVFVFVATLGIVYFMMTNVVPMFSDVFNQFGSELPPLTQKILYISENFPFYMLIFTIIVFAIIAFVYTQKNQEWYRKFFSSLVLKIPKVGGIIQLVYLSRFTQTLHLLLASKTSLVKSLDLTEKMVKFYPIQMAIQQIKKDILKGRSLHSGMANYKIFPKRMLSLIKVGEEVNQLDDMLLKLSKQNSEDLKHQTQLIGKLMEPIIILIIGGIVGVILVAMYMPMFNLSNLLSQ